MYKTLKEYSKLLKHTEENSVIIDIAGKDSLAAIIEFLKTDSDVSEIIPIIVKAPTEYGDINKFHKSYNEFMNYIQKRFKIIITNEFLIEEPLLWRLINGKYVAMLIKKYGFYSPCPGCHLYLHSIRGYMGRNLGVKRIISGERVRHENKIKLNQLDISLQKHAKLLKKFEIEHIQPLRDINSDSKVYDILKETKINEFYHYNCVYSGNYIGLDDRRNIPKRLENYYDFSMDIIDEYFNNLELVETYDELENFMNQYIIKKFSS